MGIATDAEQMTKTSKPDIRRLYLDLMKIQTERDKQVKVGASNFAQPCARCLAEDLQVSQRHGVQKYWMGAWIGTAVHERMEALTRQHRPEWQPEQRFVLGELPGYGTIKSTTDLYIPALKTVVDTKTTTREKLVFIKDALTNPPSKYDISSLVEARYKVTGYIGQVMSYGAGVVKAGHEVEWVSLAFICRDGKEDKDVWAWTTEYDPEYAAKVWDRLERLWAWLQQGGDPVTLESVEGCYRCSRRED